MDHHDKQPPGEMAHEAGAFEMGRTEGVRLAQGIIVSLSNENEALRETLERVLDLLVAVEESRRHGMFTSSLVQVDEVIGLARSLLTAPVRDWDVASWRPWPESLTDDQADLIAQRVGTTLGETPTIGLVKAWYTSILGCLTMLKACDTGAEDPEAQRDGD